MVHKIWTNWTIFGNNDAENWTSMLKIMPKSEHEWILSSILEIENWKWCWKLNRGGIVVFYVQYWKWFPKIEHGPILLSEWSFLRHRRISMDFVRSQTVTTTNTWKYDRHMMFSGSRTTRTLSNPSGTMRTTLEPSYKYKTISDLTINKKDLKI